jgi:hypothetical protein
LRGWADYLVLQCRARFTALAELKQSLLRKAFAGELIAEAS